MLRVAILSQSLIAGWVIFYHSCSFWKFNFMEMRSCFFEEKGKIIISFSWLEFFSLSFAWCWWHIHACISSSYCVVIFELPKKESNEEVSGYGSRFLKYCYCFMFNNIFDFIDTLDYCILILSNLVFDILGCFYRRFY